MHYLIYYSQNPRRTIFLSLANILQNYREFFSNLFSPTYSANKWKYNDQTYVFLILILYSFYVTILQVVIPSSSSSTSSPSLLPLMSLYSICPYFVWHTPYKTIFYPHFTTLFVLLSFMHLILFIWNHFPSA